ncbi:MAG: hypothetical protein ACTS7D_00705 [Candidatus Hodgkinia cicadicola]
MDSVAQFGRSLLIAADEIEGEAVTILVINELRSNIKVLSLNTQVSETNRNTF